jgi:glyoxylase-like metal-dependent hydrolase (beta-lactamase superfamily II)
MIEPLVVGMMSTNAYVYTDKADACFIIDPGGDAKKLIKLVEKTGLSLTGIICTHGHLDHTGAVGPIMEYFTGLGQEPFLAVHSRDVHYLGERSEETHRRSFASLGILGTGYFKMIFNPSPEPSVILEEGTPIPHCSLEVLYTPGHTEGSVSLYHREDGVLFSGDTLFSGGIGRTDLPEGSYEKIVSSIREKLYTLPSDVTVYSGHGPATTIGREKKYNPFVQ